MNGFQEKMEETEMARRRLQLWFFRDLNEEQRMGLLRLFELRFDFPPTHRDQMKALDYVVKQLRGTT